MNFIQLMGYLGADAETRFTPNGQKVTNFRIAVTTRKAGKEETVWYRVTLWGDRFDKLLPYLKKGSALIVGGELGKPEIYNDREGKPQISLEVTAEYIRFSPFGKSDGKSEKTGQDSEALQTQYTKQRPQAAAASSPHAASPGSELDDELPF